MATNNSLGSRVFKAGIAASFLGGSLIYGAFATDNEPAPEKQETGNVADTGNNKTPIAAPNSCPAASAAQTALEKALLDCSNKADGTKTPVTPATPIALPTTKSSTTTHVIQRGDTLSKVCKEYGLSAQAIVDKNPESFDKQKRIKANVGAKLDLTGIAKLPEGANCLDVKIKQPEKKPVVGKKETKKSEQRTANTTPRKSGAVTGGQTRQHKGPVTEGQTIPFNRQCNAIVKQGPFGGLYAKLTEIPGRLANCFCAAAGTFKGTILLNGQKKDLYGSRGREQCEPRETGGRDRTPPDTKTRDPEPENPSPENPSPENPSGDCKGNCPGGTGQDTGKTSPGETLGGLGQPSARDTAIANEKASGVTSNDAGDNAPSAETGSKASTSEAAGQTSDGATGAADGQSAGTNGQGANTSGADSNAGADAGTTAGGEAPGSQGQGADSNAGADAGTAAGGEAPGSQSPAGGDTSGGIGDGGGRRGDPGSDKQGSLLNKTPLQEPWLTAQIETKRGLLTVQTQLDGAPPIVRLGPSARLG